MAQDSPTLPRTAERPLAELVAGRESDPGALAMGRADVRNADGRVALTQGLDVGRLLGCGHVRNRGARDVDGPVGRFETAKEIFAREAGGTS